MRKDDRDFATGKPINLKNPEEKVRQELEKVLVKDHDYPKSALKINVPVQIGSKTCYADIAVYENHKIVGIAETKKPKRKDGVEQLRSYMSATSTCRWGVWTNGDEEICATRDENGEIKFDEALRIPRCGERYPHIKSYGDLIPATNLKRTFKLINNALYANTNLARTEKQGAEMVRLLFCKLTDEYNIRKNKKEPAFQIYRQETDKAGKKQLRKRINRLWDETKGGYLFSSIFAPGEKIEMDDYSLSLIVSKLQGYSLLKTNKDIVGDAFEVFSEKQFAGEKGQFFTPRPVVNMVVSMIAPTKNDRIIDPACGSGGFLISALDYITRDITDEMEKRKIAEHCLFGIDKESDLAKICRAHMSILGDGQSNIARQDSLKPLEDWDSDALTKITLGEEKFGRFDICMTNPPFGSTIKIEQPHVLRNFDLGHKWERTDGVWRKTEITKPTPPQILFLELCLKLIRPGGKVGIVLPDGLLGNKGDDYIRHFIRTHAEVLAVVDCPTETFMPHTGTKTSVLILAKKGGKHKEQAKKPRIFLAVAENCGHTMRAVDTGKEDFSRITQNYLAQNTRDKHLGFAAQCGDVLVPRYYDPRIVAEIRRLEKENDLEMPTVAELRDKAIIEVGNMPSSANSADYDLHGGIRFIRTSDISGYELYGRTQKNVTEETYEQYREKQDLREGDILFIKDGDTKIGETAILLDDHDLRVLVQGHFKKIRALKIDPFLLLWMLNRNIVKKQIRQRVFNQSTLSTIGSRIDELRLPLPATKPQQARIAKRIKDLVITRRNNLRLLQEEIMK